MEAELSLKRLEIIETQQDCGIRWSRIFSFQLKARRVNTSVWRNGKKKSKTAARQQTIRQRAAERC
jgi:hypothetical protein